MILSATCHIGYMDSIWFYLTLQTQYLKISAFVFPSIIALISDSYLTSKYPSYRSFHIKTLWHPGDIIRNSFLRSYSFSLQIITKSLHTTSLLIQLKRFLLKIPLWNKRQYFWCICRYENFADVRYSSLIIFKDNWILLSWRGNWCIKWFKEDRDKYKISV